MHHLTNLEFWTVVYYSFDISLCSAKKKRTEGITLITLYSQFIVITIIIKKRKFLILKPQFMSWPYCVEYSLTKTIHKALSMHIKGFYLSSVMYRKKLLRRTRRDISVLQPEGGRLLCPLWWGARTLSKSAPHTFLCHKAAIPQMPLIVLFCAPSLT